MFLYITHGSEMYSFIINKITQVPMPNIHFLIFIKFHCKWILVTLEIPKCHVIFKFQPRRNHVVLPIHLDFFVHNKIYFTIGDHYFVQYYSKNNFFNKYYR